MAAVPILVTCPFGGWDRTHRRSSGAYRWPTGADLAPDALFDAIRERGVWHSAP